jgi:hypothetical protein
MGYFFNYLFFNNLNVKLGMTEKLNKEFKKENKIGFFHMVDISHLCKSIRNYLFRKKLTFTTTKKNEIFSMLDVCIEMQTNIMKLKELKINLKNKKFNLKINFKNFFYLS